MAACPACTFINADDATACEMCGASLGSAPPTGAQLGSAPPAAAAVKACAPSLGKRTAAHAGSTSSTDLLRLWQGDLVEPLLALLPLKAIASVPAVSRRFRDQQWRTYSLIARQTGTICTTTSALLDAVRWTGRDDRWSRFDGSSPGAWEPLEETSGTFTVRISVSRPEIESPRLRFPSPWHSLDIETEDPPNGRGDHGGGLTKRLDSDEFLCIRRVTYSFSFKDLNEAVSHENPGQHGFAVISFGPPENAFAGLLVEPSAYPDSGDDPWYELQWWAQDREDEEATPIMIVKPGAIYAVDMRFDWTVRDSYGLVDVSVKSLTGDRHYGRRTLYFDRRPLTAINLYNYTASHASFSSVDVRYSKRTPRDFYRAEIVPAEDSEE